jgi:hypothetical protein
MASNTDAHSEVHIQGTPSADTIVFTSADTIVDAGDGANTITGTSGDNTISAGGGADTITVTFGDNTIEAGGGANTITATSGENTITTAEGADTITATSGSNTIEAGGGANTITATAGHNTITTAEGADTITLTCGNNIIEAGVGANTITATSGNNIITAGSGADTITVTSGNNTIIAGDGANTITASSGRNIITAGDGADTITAGDGGNIVIAGEGSNTVATGDGRDKITTGDGIDTIATGGGDDVVYAGGGANTIATGAGNDIVFTGSGIDTIATGSGDDRINIKGGTDTIAAGAGNDTLIADFSAATGAVTISALTGAFSAGYAGTVSGLGVATYAGVENFEITSGRFNDAIITGDGADIVRSGGGSDTVMAGGGVDNVVYTMALKATADVDNYTGGNGVDTLTLEFTAAEYLIQEVQDDIADYLAFLADNTNLNSEVYKFTAFKLSATEFETLKVFVDDVELDLSGDPQVEPILPVDLSDLGQGAGNDARGFVINGASVGDQSGFSVSSAGDVNGDGLDDLIVGAPSVEGENSQNNGSSYVVFGKEGSNTVNLSTIEMGVGGFVISGSVGDQSGFSVSSLGDVNGDGLDDLIVGAPSANGEDSGESYVVFGKTDGNAVDLGKVAEGNGSFVISGANSLDAAGFSVSSAGDVNGDGYLDLIIGAPGVQGKYSPSCGGESYYSTEHGEDTGASYVVFGRAESVAVDLSQIEAHGFVINGASEFDAAGFSVSAAGDVNNDGFDDLIVGAPDAEGNAENSGVSYVVYGKADNTAIDLSEIVGHGFEINGVSTDDQSGYSVGSAGDVNGDGFDDLIVGAPNADGNAKNSGASYVVFGKSDDDAVNLSTLEENGTGFVINGTSEGDQFGFSVSTAGDMNGDGFDDLIIGAPAADGSVDNSGVSYVVYGKADSGAVDLSAIAEGVGGFVINGTSGGDGFGTSVSAAGDVNGDGFDDLIVGAPNADSVTTLHTDELDQSGPGNLDGVIWQPAPIGGESDQNMGDASKVDSGVSYVIFGGPDVLIFNEDTNDNSATTGQSDHTANLAGIHEIAAHEAHSENFEGLLPEGEYQLRLLDSEDYGGQDFVV